MACFFRTTFENFMTFSTKVLIQDFSGPEKSKDEFQDRWEPCIEHINDLKLKKILGFWPVHNPLAMCKVLRFWFLHTT